MNKALHKPTDDFYHKGIPKSSEVIKMVMHQRSRRILAVALIILGAVLMFFAPSKYWMGGVLLALGVFIEAIGIALEKKS